MIGPKRKSVTISAVLAVLAIGCVVPLAACAADVPHKLKPGEATADENVRKALRIEFEPGDAAAQAAEREALLAAALTELAGYAPAHWAQGEVQLKSGWISFETAVDQFRHSTAWKSYREMRRGIEPTGGGQLRLADFCRKNKLLDQERAHLSVVVSLEPEHPTARRRLGQQKIAGAWMDRKETVAAKEHSKAVAEAIRKNKGTYYRLSQDLKSGQITLEEGIKALKDLSNVEHIPGLELLLSTPHESGALAVIGALSNHRDGEGSVSLVRHALGHPSAKVRAEATEALKERDWHGFVPLLLASLQSPVVSREALVAAPNNQLIWRRVLYADKQDEEQLATLDRVFDHLGPFDPLSGAFAAFVASQESQRVGQDLERFNAAITASNKKTFQLLRDVTGASTSDTPDDWWKWWEDYREVVRVDAKDRKNKHDRTHTPYTGRQPYCPPPPREYVMWDTFRTSSCLAPGTEVWTDAGPVAVDLIQAGDLVLSQNAETGELAYKPVLEPTNRPPAVVLRLHVDDDVIRATGGHGFWVSGTGWLKARELKAGMRLHTPRGAKTLAKVESETEPVKAFNLVVADFHTYFVGKHRVLSYDNTLRAPAETLVPGLTDE